MFRNQLHDEERKGYKEMRKGASLTIEAMTAQPRISQGRSVFTPMVSDLFTDVTQ